MTKYHGMFGGSSVLGLPSAADQGETIQAAAAGIQAAAAGVGEYVEVPPGVGADTSAALFTLPVVGDISIAKLALPLAAGAGVYYFTKKNRKRNAAIAAAALLLLAPKLGL